MERLRPNDQRANLAITMIWIVMAIEFASMISNFFQFRLLESISDGEFVSQGTAEWSDTRQQIIAVFFLIAYVVSAVTFIQWFRRAYFNLHLKVKHLAHDEGWAAGSWFVPIITLYRPFQIMKELYDETILLLKKRNLTVPESVTSGLLGLWWTLWIINNIIGQISFRVSMNAEEIDELINSTIIDTVGNIIGIPLAIITVKVIKDYARLEPLLLEIKEDEAPANDLTEASIV